MRGATLAAFLLRAVAPVAAAERSITIAAVGDIMMGSDFPTSVLPPADGAHLFDSVAAILRAADIAFGNLEGPLTRAIQSTKDISSGRSYAFRTPPDYARHLAAAGLDIVSLANNHAEDFGIEGLRASEAALDAHGIRYAGKRGVAPVLDAGGVRVAFIGADTYGGMRSIVDGAPLLAEIATIAAAVDILVVSVHAGAEGEEALHIRDGAEFFQGENRGNLVDFARRAVEAGADLILAHGPHVPRGMEVHQGRLIAYSLGNFCNYRGFSLVGARGLAPILEVQLSPTGALLGGRVHSFRQTPPGGPVVDQTNGAADLIALLSREDFPATAPHFDEAGRFGPGPGGVPIALGQPDAILARNARPPAVSNIAGRMRRPRPLRKAGRTGVRPATDRVSPVTARSCS